MREEEERLFCRRFYFHLLALKLELKWNPDQKGNKEAGEGKHGAVRHLVCASVTHRGTCPPAQPHAEDRMSGVTTTPHSSHPPRPLRGTYERGFPGSIFLRDNIILESNHHGILAHFCIVMPNPEPGIS